MGHRVTIGGTGRDIAGGKTLVSGTARTLTGGRTRVAGTTYDIPLDRFDPVLNNNTWEQISLAAQKGVAEAIWSVGDGKEVTLSGSVNSRDISGTYCCYILGFNHNAALEGENRIHFQLGKSALENGQEQCLGYAPMNKASDSDARDGWRGCDMRNIYLGTDPTSCAGTFLATLPQDLLAQLRPVQKYTDNGTMVATNVSATTDYVWLPSEKEICGSISVGNPSEGDHQQQYAYYASGVPLLKYCAQDNRKAEWWLRSRAKGGTSYYYFSFIGDDGQIGKQYPDDLKGYTPIFCV